jgi:hypothetical protein
MNTKYRSSKLLLIIIFSILFFLQFNTTTAATSDISSVRIQCNNSKDIKNSNGSFGASTKAWSCFYENVKKCKPANINVKIGKNNTATVFSVFGKKDGQCIVTGPLSETYVTEFKNFSNNSCKIDPSLLSKYSKNTVSSKIGFNIANSLIFQPKTAEHKKYCDLQSPKVETDCSFIYGCSVKTIITKDQEDKTWRNMVLDESEISFIKNISSLIKGGDLNIFKFNPFKNYIDLVDKLTDEQFARFKKENSREYNQKMSKIDVINIMKEIGKFPDTKTVSSIKSMTDIEKINYLKNNNIMSYLSEIEERFADKSIVNYSEDWGKYLDTKETGWWGTKIIDSNDVYTSFVIAPTYSDSKICQLGDIPVISALIKPDMTLYFLGMSCWNRTVKEISEIKGYSWSAEVISKISSKKIEY